MNVGVLELVLCGIPGFRCFGNPDPVDFNSQMQEAPPDFESGCHLMQVVVLNSLYRCGVRATGNLFVSHELVEVMHMELNPRTGDRKIE